VLVPGGGEALLPTIGAICRQELGWDDARWEAEADAYLAGWRACYSLPALETIPNWHEMPAAAQYTPAATGQRVTSSLS
jgi:glycerol-3-phosphate dehydrogenase